MSEAHVVRAAEVLADALMVNAAVNAFTWSGKTEELNPQKIAEFVLETRRAIDSPRRSDLRMWQRQQR
jgi:hypothetical protein